MTAGLMISPTIWITTSIQNMADTILAKFTGFHIREGVEEKFDALIVPEMLMLFAIYFSEAARNLDHYR